MDNPPRTPKKLEETTPDYGVGPWRIDTWFPQLDGELRQTLKKYQEELGKFNKTINLVSPKTLAVSDALHFADSILATQMISRSGMISEIYDFGSGNGFPGLVYAALQKGTKVHLVEVDGRKAEFLKHMAGVMKLSNVQVHIRTVESLPEKSVKHAMSRGFAPISKSLLFSRKIFQKDGTYFHMKSEEWATEVGQIPTQLCSFWLPALLGNYRLPIGEVQFAIVKTTKIAD